MAINTLGDVVDTIAIDGDLTVGNTAFGAMSVDGGSVKSITPVSGGAAGSDARLVVGSLPGGSGTVTVSGAGSLLEVVRGGLEGAGAAIQIGHDPYGLGAIGGHGHLVVENSAKVTGQSILIGEGGRVSGNGGNLQGYHTGVIIKGGTLGDADGAIQNLTIVGGLAFSDGAYARFDISSSANDHVTVRNSTEASYLNSGTVNFQMNVIDGYHFTEGERRTFFTSDYTIPMATGSTVTINGQHADFSYYLGFLGLVSGNWEFGLVALNSGSTGGSTTLDFGAVRRSAKFSYDAAAGLAHVSGGNLQAGGIAVGVDKVVGTLESDFFNASQAQQAMAFFGGWGYDTLIGGSGRDTAIYAAQRSDAVITRNSDGTVTVSTNVDGVDTLRSIERLQFADQTVSLALVKGDLGGDGASDILWRNANGAVAQWSLSGSPGGTDLGNPGPSWNIVGTGDFDGDGISDILWRDNTGQNTIWRMVDGQHVGGYGLSQVDTSWGVAGIGDFDGDGTSDILWRNADGSNAIWKMQNGAHVGGYGMLQVGTTWSIAGVGDFNGDSTSDVLWRNENGNVQVWTTQNGQHVDGTNLGDVDSNWAIKGVADFTGDGTDDILWQRTTGEIQVWAMQNGQRTGGGFIETVADPTWRIVGTGDYNGDGTADILWRNTSSGHNTVWTMQNGQHTGGFAVETVADQTWSISPI